MSDLLRGTKRNGSGLVSELLAKKRLAAVDWKEHPLEVMASLDRLAGKTWKKDSERWEFTETLDLDRCLPDAFLAASASAFEKVGLVLLSFDRGSDEAIFGVVPAKDANAVVRAIATRKAKAVRVRAAKTPKKKAAGEAAKKAAAEARAELDRKIANLATRDGAIVQDFAILYVVRLEMAAGATVTDVRALLDFAVTNELAGFERQLFRRHGPNVEPELLGAALLVGRGHELVRGLAHVLSLGQRSKTSLWKAFLDRDLPPTWNRGEAKDVDAVLTAPSGKLSSAAKRYLGSRWSTWSRGMKGSRASLFVTGVAGSRDVNLDVGEALEKYVARELLPVRPSKKPAKPLRGLPKLVATVGEPENPRDPARPQADAIRDARTLEAWVRESLACAAAEKSGVYLRSVPETAAQIAACIYAAGAPLASVRAWLAFAVDLEIARCTGKYAEDVLVWTDVLRDVAGAAILLDRGSELASAWREARTTQGDQDRAAFDAMLAWLDGKRATPAKHPPARRIPKALAAALTTRDAAGLEGLVRAHGLLPQPWPEQPWPGPFSVLVTALAKDLREVPLAAKGATMMELIGRQAAPTPSLAWPKPRTKLPLAELRGVALDAMQRIDVAADPGHSPKECLLVARCVHALGAPPAETGKWIHRAVDLAKKTKHLDEDLVGAARLVGRARELASSIHDYTKDAKSAEHAFAVVLRAYASNESFETPAVLKKRYFFHELAVAANAARTVDLPAMRRALGHAPWQHRREWTGIDKRRWPPDLSWFVMGLCVDANGVDGIPPSAKARIDEAIVRAAIDGCLT